jgi:hypothetical protein
MLKLIRTAAIALAIPAALFANVAHADCYSVPDGQTCQWVCSSGDINNGRDCQNVCTQNYRTVCNDNPHTGQMSNPNPASVYDGD